MEIEPRLDRSTDIGTSTDIGKDGTRLSWMGLDHTGISSEYGVSVMAFPGNKYLAICTHMATCKQEQFQKRSKFLNFFQNNTI